LDSDSSTPTITRLATVIQTTSPPPTRKVNTVEPLVAQPGQTYWKAPARQMTIPQPFHHREKPATTVCPVASV
jgi:hypothetical protein